MKHVCLLFFLVCCLNSFSQRRYKIIIYGLQAKFDNSERFEKCQKAIEKKYHLKYSANRGCVERKRWKKHNERMERKLKKKNGKDWEDRMYEEIGNCNQ